MVYNKTQVKLAKPKDSKKAIIDDCVGKKIPRFAQITYQFGDSIN